MTTHGSSAAPSPQQSGMNPFARALSEARGSSDKENENSLNSHDQTDSAPAALDQKNSERNMLDEQKRERLRQELHRKINPVDQKDIFNAREKQVQQEIDQLRSELKKFAEEVNLLKKDIDLTLMTTVSHPGQEGKYYLSFFQKLRELIILLRQRVHSARTWSHAFQSKKSRKDLNFNSKGSTKTKTIWDSMNNERQIARAGG